MLNKVNTHTLIVVAVAVAVAVAAAAAGPSAAAVEVFMVIVASVNSVWCYGCSSTHTGIFVHVVAWHSDDTV